MTAPAGRESLPETAKGRGSHPNTRKNLKPIKKGEVRNPTGANGWTKARERMRKLLADNQPTLGQRLIDISTGVVEEPTGERSLHYALAPLMPAPPKQEVDLNVTHSIADLARKAAELSAGERDVTPVLEEGDE